MRRHRVGRFCATLLLLWFAVTSGAPSVLHACPVHGDANGSAPQTEHSAHSHQLPDSSDQACTCIGDCAVNGVVPGLPATRAAVVVVATSEVDAPLPAPDSPAVTQPAFVLPYANGPPGSRRAA